MVSRSNSDISSGWEHVEIEDAQDAEANEGAASVDASWYSPLAVVFVPKASQIFRQTLRQLILGSSWLILALTL